MLKDRTFLLGLGGGGGLVPSNILLRVQVKV